MNFSNSKYNWGWGKSKFKRAHKFGSLVVVVVVEVVEEVVAVAAAAFNTSTWEGEAGRSL
jgi:hypothetical protein